MDRLTIGQMAKLYNISERTLRLYHDVGLLFPQHIDENTGYRYYSQSQSARLETIIQMKAVGLSLKQIKKMLDAHDLSAFEALLCEQIDAVESKINDLIVIQNALKKNLASCKSFRNPPVLNTVYIEYFSKRTAFYFDIEPYDLKNENSRNYWRKALKNVKSSLHDMRLPLSLFCDVGCMINQEDIINRSLICSSAFILTHEKIHPNAQYTMPPGTYVCVIDKWMAGNSKSEVTGIMQLLDYIEKNDYKIAGPYFGEVIADSSIFDCTSSDVLVKMQIPVKLIPAKVTPKL